MLHGAGSGEPVGVVAAQDVVAARPGPEGTKALTPQVEDVPQQVEGVGGPDAREAGVGDERPEPGFGLAKPAVIDFGPGLGHQGVRGVGCPRQHPVGQALGLGEGPAPGGDDREPGKGDDLVGIDFEGAAVGGAGPVEPPRTGEGLPKVGVGRGEVRDEGDQVPEHRLGLGWRLKGQEAQSQGVDDAGVPGSQVAGPL